MRYEIIIADASNGRKVIDIIPLGLEFLVLRINLLNLINH